MQKNSGKNIDHSRRLKCQKNQNYMNNNEASTSRNVHVSNTEYQELNTEISISSSFEKVDLIVLNYILFFIYLLILPIFFTNFFLFCFPSFFP